MTAEQIGTVLVVGCEPAAFSACLALVEDGIHVRHVLPSKIGISGSTRDIGFAYPELGEPWERLEHALGTEIATEFHYWAKEGIEDLCLRLPATVKRGSRLSVTRTEQESKLVSEDALRRNSAPVHDQVRLMSGAAASNYAPIDGAELSAFETHAITFVPVTVLNEILNTLQASDLYEAFPLEGMNTNLSRIDSQNSVRFLQKGLAVAEGDLCVVAHGLATADLTHRLTKSLLPIAAQAFRTPPLKETTRSSVVGITASWGYERYRFDAQMRLLGCGIDPTRGAMVGEKSEVLPDVMERFAKRAAQLFTDFDGSVDDLMQWSVEFTGSCDGLPLLGPLPGEPRIQVAAGFGASAWSRGWQAGQLLGKAISGNYEPSPLFQRCTPRRFLPTAKKS